MSWHACAEAKPHERAASPAVELLLVPRTSDLGGFEVRRALPSRHRRMVGPFIFFDRMGPSELPPGHGLDVRPHPHIGLATITYLFSGSILHRDSLGTVQTIRPGEINWMTAGSGIAHSERTPPEARIGGSALSGIQAWVALPESGEETVPSFVHHPAATLPVIEHQGVVIRVIAGTLSGVRSPVETMHETIYADIEMMAGAEFCLEAGLGEERAVYIAAGALDIDGHLHTAERMLVLAPGSTARLRTRAPARLLLLGGAAMDGPRYIWWNFVSSRKERIEQAKADWQAGRFERVVDETELIPLPEMPGP